MTALSEHYDVLVAGGGSAGAAAAVAAREAGAARVLLVERYGILGGAATVSSVLTYCGFFTEGEPWERVVRGIGDRVLTALDEMGMSREVTSRTSGNRFVALDPEAVKLVLDRLVIDAGVEVAFHRQLIAARSDDGVIRDVTIVGDDGLTTITADAFVDATGGAALAVAAGAEVDQPGPGETHQASTMMLRIGGLDPEAAINGGLIRDAVLAGKASAPMPLPRETGVATRLPGSGDLIAILADVAFDPFDVGELSAAEMTGRELARAYTDILREHLPGAERAHLVSTGPQIGIREGRRVAGRTPVTRDDVVNAHRPVDGIARAGWPIEVHPEAGRSVYESVGGRSWYGVPYGALVSRSRDNLFAAGRTISCDRAAFSSLRVMGTAFATGQAAGAAAAVLSSGGVHDPALVQRLLVEAGALI